MSEPNTSGSTNKTVKFAEAPKPRNDRRNNRKGKGNKKGTEPHRTEKFVGKCEALKGYIYDCSDSKQADQVVSTTLEIATYVGSNYKHGGDVRLALTNLEPPTVPYPVDPGLTVGVTIRKIFESKCSSYYKREETY